MKAINALGAIALAAYAVIALSSCSGTSNGSNSTTAAATPGTCTVGWNGQYMNQYGQSCSSSALGCSGYTYTNGQYYNGGTQVNGCGTGYLPSTGYGGGQYVTGGVGGCSQWTQIYGVQYVPVDLSGNGTDIVCINFQYLQQYASGAGINSQYYSNPNYWYQYPPTLYTGGYQGYGYGQYPSSCNTSLNLGAIFGLGGGGAVGGSIGLCF